MLKISKTGQKQSYKTNTLNDSSFHKEIAYHISNQNHSTRGLFTFSNVSFQKHIGQLLNPK